MASGVSLIKWNCGKRLRNCSRGKIHWFIRWEVRLRTHVSFSLFILSTTLFTLSLSLLRTRWPTNGCVAALISRGDVRVGLSLSWLLLMRSNWMVLSLQEGLATLFHLSLTGEFNIDTVFAQSLHTTLKPLTVSSSWKWFVIAKVFLSLCLFSS